METCVLSRCVSTSVRSLILPLGLQSQECLLFGLSQENLLAPDLELYFPTCCMCKTVACEVILGVRSLHF